MTMRTVSAGLGMVKNCRSMLPRWSGLATKNGLMPSEIVVM
jgi:hypothetical protein